MVASLTLRVGRCIGFAFFVVACGGVVATGDGGTTATDGADGSSTSSSGIACESTTCKAGTDVCCVQKSGAACLSQATGGCAGQVFRLACDDTDDCAGQTCCFTNMLQSAEAATFCVANG